MRNLTILRLLLVGLLLYVAWPYIPLATLKLEVAFWGIWLGLLLLVVGANLATLLEMTRPPAIEQKKIKQRNTQ